MSAILFTAFEPSGDQLAAPVIARLRRERPEAVIYAIGGPKMAAAGATILEETGKHAVMLGGALGQIKAHRQRVLRMKQWLSAHAIDALVPVDSPAANWAMCKLVRSLHPKAKIIHLAAPQIWAWARWRIRKLRRLTDHVLCLLPFEPQWFGQRGVPCTFVGHPLYQMSATLAPPHSSALKSPHPRLALLPGSRRSEIDANWPTMYAVFEELASIHPTLQGVVAATNDDIAMRIVNRIPGTTGFSDPLPTEVRAQRDQHLREELAAAVPISLRLQEGTNLELRVGSVDAILDWADAVLVVSGTATLHTAVHRKPMVILYNLARWKWHLIGRFLVNTRTFTLPNLIAEAAGKGRIVPEFVPHFGRVEPLVAALEPLLTEESARAKQAESLHWLAEQFEGVDFVERACGQILTMLPHAAGST